MIDIFAWWENDQVVLAWCTWLYRFSMSSHLTSLLWSVTVVDVDARRKIRVWRGLQNDLTLLYYWLGDTHLICKPRKNVMWQVVRQVMWRVRSEKIIILATVQEAAFNQNFGRCWRSRIYRMREQWSWFTSANCLNTTNGVFRGVDISI